MRHNTINIVIIGLLFAATTVAAPSTTMPRQSDISSTLHNLSTTGAGSVKATSESQICVFCHTPHGANADAQTINAPLWNREITLGNDTTYIKYDSSSIQANIDANPGGPSKLCLSCHDGTLALGSLNVLNGGAATVGMQGTNAEKMPDGTGANTGFTRNLGTDLSGDHPISFGFDTNRLNGIRLAVADGELRDPLDADGAHIAIGSKIAPLDKDGKVQCTTCHDPHVSGQDLPTGTTLGGTTQANNIKFLRARRFQMSAPQGGDFDLANDILCLECHDKLGTAWSQSAHADPTVANELYKIESSNQRQFPADIAVWQAACLNCHDTHTVQGANRLLREGTLDGTDTTLEILPAAKLGGKPALEETCFQCHTTPTQSILKAGSGAPNIETEFGKATRMPLAVYDVNNQEPHDIVDANFNEPQLQLGFGDLNNRHAECTDCHNPHRMIRNALANGTGLSTKGTHPHTELGTTVMHTNAISGVLKGISGVEPIYDAGANGRKFGTPAAMPAGFTVKEGLGANAVTSEYQICLKCHSNYGYNDKGTPDNAQAAVSPNVANGRPETGGTGLTPYVAISTSTRVKAQTNSFRNYTNQAMEFQAPGNHACEGNCATGTGQDGGANVSDSINHRSWHPVMAPTGRTTTMRGAAQGAWLPPFSNAIGTQTMYCTDCHGASTGADKDVIPNDVLTVPTPWGPHGSNNNYILKGTWSRGSAQADPNNLLCFKCHDSNDYNGSGSDSGFNTGRGDGHNEIHKNDRIRMTLDCMWCHVAVPHGWKNKSLLVNLNDVGPEVMCRNVDNTVYNISPACVVGVPIPAGSSIPNSALGGSDGYNNPPYYVNARLKVTDFRSGSWSESDCGGKGTMQATCDRDSSY